MSRDGFYRYPTQPEYIVDGDTIDVSVDLGFKLSQEMRLRIRGIDTAEIFRVKKESDEYQNGIAHKSYVESWMEEAVEEWSGEWPIEIDTYRHEKGKYGRYVADVVRRSDGARLAEDLLDEFDTVEVPDY